MGTHKITKHMLAPHIQVGVSRTLERAKLYQRTSYPAPPSMPPLQTETEHTHTQPHTFTHTHTHKKDQKMKTNSFLRWNE